LFPFSVPFEEVAMGKNAGLLTSNLGDMGVDKTNTRG
jgi:uncharacterized membrane protein